MERFNKLMSILLIVLCIGVSLRLKTADEGEGGDPEPERVTTVHHGPDGPTNAQRAHEDGNGGKGGKVGKDNDGSQKGPDQHRTSGVHTGDHGDGKVGKGNGAGHHEDNSGGTTLHDQHQEHEQHEHVTALEHGAETAAERQAAEAKQLEELEASQTKATQLVTDAVTNKKIPSLTGKIDVLLNTVELRQQIEVQLAELSPGETDPDLEKRLAELKGVEALWHSKFIESLEERMSHWFDKMGYNEGKIVFKSPTGSIRAGTPERGLLSAEDGEEEIKESYQHADTNLRLCLAKLTPDLDGEGALDPTLDALHTTLLDLQIKAWKGSEEGGFENMTEMRSTMMKEMQTITDKLDEAKQTLYALDGGLAAGEQGPETLAEKLAVKIGVNHNLVESNIARRYKLSIAESKSIQKKVDTMLNAIDGLVAKEPAEFDGLTRDPSQVGEKLGKVKTLIDDAIFNLEARLAAMDHIPDRLKTSDQKKAKRTLEKEVKKLKYRLADVEQRIAVDEATVKATELTGILHEPPADQIRSRWSHLVDLFKLYKTRLVRGARDLLIDYGSKRLGDWLSRGASGLKARISTLTAGTAAVGDAALSHLAQQNHVVQAASLEVELQVKKLAILAEENDEAQEGGEVSAEELENQQSEAEAAVKQLDQFLGVVGDEAAKLHDFANTALGVAVVAPVVAGKDSQLAAGASGKEAPVSHAESAADVEKLTEEAGVVRSIAAQYEAMAADGNSTLTTAQGKLKTIRESITGRKGKKRPTAQSVFGGDGSGGASEEA